MTTTRLSAGWTYILAGVCMLVATAAPAQDTAPAEFALSAEAASLTWRGEEILGGSLPSVEWLIFESRSVNPENNFYTYEFTEGSTEATATRVDAEAGTVERSYPWGSLRVRHVLEGRTLRLRVFITNETDRPIANFRVRLADLRLAGVPSGLLEKKHRLQRSDNRPLAIEFETSNGRLYACYESFAPPVRLGLGESPEGSKGVYPLVTAGGVAQPLPGEITVPPKGIPQVPPGETLEIEFALRLSDPDVHRHAVLRDFHRRYQEFLQPMLEWPDRRPIGATFMLGEWGRKPALPGMEGTNPRRYFSPMTDTVDVFSPQGKALLRKAMQGLARRTVDALEKMGAQGIILWNLEGGFHSTGFVGDPRMLPILSPELEEAMDDYFRIIREAGFRTGCTIRHPQLRWDGKNHRWTQGVGNANPNADPVRDGYDRLVPDHTPWWTVYPIARRLSSKIGYAKKRWGCTMFYYDVSLITRFYGDGSQRTTHLLADHIWRKIREDHPDVLIIPEIHARGHVATAHLAHIAPYGQTGYGRVRPIVGERDLGTREYTRDVVPGYFGFNYIHDAGGDPWKPRTRRINEIVWGEILGTDGWSMGPKQEAIAEHYRQASDKLRRVVSFARRFDLIDTPGDVLPLPYALRNARRIPVADLVTDPPGSEQLRAFTANSADHRQAALLLAWYGYPHTPPASLRADLPGVELAGEHRWVWDVETGELLNRAEDVHVPAAPATMFRTLYVRASDTPPNPAPKGVSMACSFDDGRGPDLGGDFLDSPGDASLTDGAAGRALDVAPGREPAAYGAVPSWLGGTLEFDLRAIEATDVPAPLIRMRHHMNTTLSLVRRDGAPGLLLEADERNDAPDASWAKLPGDDGWRRVVLAWEAGQYRVYVDGRRTILHAAPAKHRWRDAAIFQPGLLVGGGVEGGGRAAIDSLILYNWSFGDPEATSRTTASGFEPLDKPDDLVPSVYLWGDSPEKADAVVVNFRRCENGSRTHKAKVTLNEAMEAGLWELASAEVLPYRGVAIVDLEYEPKAPPGGAPEPAETDHDLAELVVAAKEYVLKVTAAAAGEDPPAREIRLTFGLDKQSVRYWSARQESERD